MQLKMSWTQTQLLGESQQVDRMASLSEAISGGASQTTKGMPDFQVSFVTTLLESLLKNQVERVPKNGSWHNLLIGLQ